MYSKLNGTCGRSVARGGCGPRTCRIAPRHPWRLARAPVRFSQAGWNRRILSIYLSISPPFWCYRRPCPGTGAPCLAAGRRPARAEGGAAGGAMAHLLPSGPLPAASASARRGAPTGIPAARVLRHVRRVVGPAHGGESDL